MQLLSDVSANQKVKVISLGGKGSVFRRKLLSMGLTPGTEIDIRRKAPLGGPLELTVRGFSLSIRQREAQNIQVQPIG